MDRVEIGKGTYGIVYAESSDIAIKSTKMDDFPSTIVEIAVLNACKHPNIVVLHTVSFGLTANELYMKKYKCDLEKYVRNFGDCGKLPIQQLYKVAHDIFAGLEYLHGRGFIHCDVRNANILVNLDPFTVALCDFGISCLVMEKRQSTCVYAATFRPPEINFHAQFGSVTTSADIWAAGCILLTLVRGTDHTPIIYDNNSFIKSIEDDSSQYACNILGISIFKSTYTSRHERLQALSKITISAIHSRICSMINDKTYFERIARDFIDIIASCLQPISNNRISAGAARGAMCGLIEIIFTALDVSPAYVSKNISADEISCLINMPSKVLKYSNNDVANLAEKIYTEYQSMGQNIIGDDTLVKYAALYIAFSICSNTLFGICYMNAYSQKTIQDAVIRIIELRNNKIF